MSKAISFLGEHTIGLSLAPTIKELLKAEYKFITPLFPWVTREGSNISRSIHNKDIFKVFGIYPRRPKLFIDSTDIEIKINLNLLWGATEGMERGIPIFAGCPLVSNFWELSDNPNFAWIKLNINPTDDFQITLANNDPLTSSHSDLFFKNNQEILKFINEYSKVLSISQALDAFREINYKSLNNPYYRRFGFSGGYKPIYFLLKN